MNILRAWVSHNVGAKWCGSLYAAHRVVTLQVRTKGTRICCFKALGWFLDFGAPRCHNVRSGWTYCDSLLNKCSHSWHVTVTGWAVAHIYCSLHPQDRAVQPEIFVDFLTLTNALQSLKHHQLLTQQKSVTSQSPYILLTYLHWLNIIKQMWNCKALHYRVCY